MEPRNKDELDPSKEESEDESDRPAEYEDRVEDGITGIMDSGDEDG